MTVAKPLAVVVAGGALGAYARFGLSELFPGIWTIAVVNVLGSLLLGVVVTVLGTDRLWRLFLGTGILGGFTTFSTFAVDAVESSPLVGVLYVVGTLVPALLAARAGMAIGESMQTRRGAR
ncbi:MAG: CrcB family protein [Rhodococcus sp.]|nr:CrcB family protein [Rhodococcus sp. (in: high G+C Gram-positive bacteria)]